MEKKDLLILFVACIIIVSSIGCAEKKESSITSPPTTMSIATTTPPATTSPPTTPSPITTPPSTSPLQIKKKVFAKDIYHFLRFGDKSEKYAKGKGWDVVLLDVVPLTYEYLMQKEVSILYITSQCRLPYSDEEINEIKKFVERGGGVYMCTRIAKRECLIELADAFGIKITEEDIGPFSLSKTSLRVTVSSSHPLLKDVSVLEVSYSSKFLEVTPPAYVVLRAGRKEPYKPIIVAIEFGEGKVVISAVDLDHYHLADNVYFFRNVLYWLQEEEI